ncbi:RNA polymerase sigma factor [Aeoliella mucimassa]|uniref:ECF RNA polymerase sigma factor SigW n=1 Tax=Aeoliella mucimassa TaxID=2527972 RepID=A0A518ANN4_9BACT|nr:RNA polymerase sigma factor [Aeoliella mucimassa]QDU56311.1 ECF RNA polymerase sigma factor SigW [Aeoliella mucimassa]
MNTSDRINDELLVIRAQQGSEQAVTELVERWQHRLWRFAWRMTDDEQAAWDVLQEAWIVMSRTIGQLEVPAAFPAWAYRITSNKARDWIRRRQTRRRADHIYSSSRTEVDPDPVDRIDQFEDLTQALAALPGSDRAILSLYYEDGFSVSQIANILEVAAGTVKSRLHYARRRLRRSLSEVHDE